MQRFVFQKTIERLSADLQHATAAVAEAEQRTGDKLAQLRLQLDGTMEAAQAQTERADAELRACTAELRAVRDMNRELLADKVGSFNAWPSMDSSAAGTADEGDRHAARPCRASDAGGGGCGPGARWLAHMNDVAVTCTQLDDSMTHDAGRGSIYAVSQQEFDRLGAWASTLSALSCSAAELCRQLQDENNAFAMARSDELTHLKHTVLHQQKGTCTATAMHRSPTQRSTG